MESNEVNFEPVWLEEGGEEAAPELLSTYGQDNDPLCQVSQLSPEYLECHVKPEILSDEEDEEGQGEGESERTIVNCEVLVEELDASCDFGTEDGTDTQVVKKSRRHQWPFGSMEATFFQHVEQSIRSFILGEDVPKECNVCCKCFPTDYVVGYQKRPQCICLDIHELPESLKIRVSQKRLVCHKCGLRMQCLQESVKCTQCNERFRIAGNLIKHVAVQCKGEPYKCKDCGKGFIRLYSLEQHMRTHSAYKCEDCGTCFSAKRDYSKHLKEHLVGKSFPCPQCDKCYDFEYLLLRHMKTHVVYSCNECDKSFLVKGQYTRHLMRHSLERPFKCELCGRLFKTNHSLSVHVNRHSLARPFVCIRCGRCFNTQYGLRRHEMTVHTMEQG